MKKPKLESIINLLENVALKEWKVRGAVSDDGHPTYTWGSIYGPYLITHIKGVKFQINKSRLYGSFKSTVYHKLEIYDKNENIVLRYHHKKHDKTIGNLYYQVLSDLKEHIETEFIEKLDEILSENEKTRT